ncbi:hypothetical protein ACFE04_016254 [Oxalis oulophora]
MKRQVGFSTKCFIEASRRARRGYGMDNVVIKRKPFCSIPSAECDENAVDDRTVRLPGNSSIKKEDTATVPINNGCSKHCMGQCSPFKIQAYSVEYFDVIPLQRSCFPK